MVDGDGVFHRRDVVHSLYAQVALKQFGYTLFAFHDETVLFGSFVFAAERPNGMQSGFIHGERV